MPANRSSDAPARRPSRFRHLWLVAAHLSLGLGIIGIVVPGLPTVPFILLASFCAARGSRRMHRWLRTHPRFGPMVRDWEDQGAVSRRAKWLATVLMALCSGIMWLAPSPLWAWVLCTGILVLVGTWLWMRPEPGAARQASEARASNL